MPTPGIFVACAYPDIMCIEYDLPLQKSLMFDGCLPVSVNIALWHPTHLHLSLTRLVFVLSFNLPFF